MLKALILLIILVAGCAPVQEMYISKTGADSFQKQILNNSKVLSMDTLSNRNETMIYIRYREKR